MLHKLLFPVVILNLFILQIVSSTPISGKRSCEHQCKEKFLIFGLDVLRTCSDGCSMYDLISQAKNMNDSNRVLKFCKSACGEGYANESFVNACRFGCDAYLLRREEEEDVQTLHLLTPLMYVRSAYNTMAHHVKQFISTSWTVYVQEDSGKVVIVQTSPKVVESSENSASKDDGNSLKDYQQGWQEAKLDWMDCISHQSGLPRWLLVVVLFGFIFALLWLCCATAVTAPNHYLSSSKKKDTGYILVCEPNNDIKIPISPLSDVNEEAPPLPTKVSLI